MKKLTLIIALSVAAIATAGRLRHPQNPLPVAGAQIPIHLSAVQQDFPFPSCPPDCH